MQSQVSLPIKTTKLTKLERKWYKEYLKCFNSSDALKNAYPNNNYAYDSIRTMAAQTKKSVFAKLSVTEDDLMEQMGLSDEGLYQDVIDGRKATRALVVDGKVVGVPDYSTRHKFTETALKLRGKLTDSSRLELTGKDGEPIRLSIIAGIGFMPPKDI